MPFLWVHGIRASIEKTVAYVCLGGLAGYLELTFM
jgi:hypothetical protein